MSGRLVRSPIAGRAYESELSTWPLSRPHEYRAFAAFEKVSRAPILLSPKQRDLWLVRLLAVAREYVPTVSLTVIRMGAPQGQLPRELLDESIFLTHEPRLATRRVLASGRSEVMEIWQDIRTDGIDEGENRVSITTFGAESVPGFLRFISEASPLAAVEVSAVFPVAAA